MDIYIKFYDIIVKVNKYITVKPSKDNYFLDITDYFYVISVDGFEIGYFKNKEEGIEKLKKIFEIIEKSQLTVTNILTIDLSTI
jgi:hypothetical protein